tara:strand:- start:1478 stop:3682 length:2205 start_codon:yes stop_codon:yes gene_type:complete
MADKEKNLADYTDDYDRLRAQKARNVGSVELRILTNLSFASGEHWVGTQNRVLFTRKRDPNKLYLVFNLAAQMLYKMMGRLSSIAPVFKARADKQDPKSIAASDVVNKLVRALDEKLDQPSRTWEILWWMSIGGVAFEYVPWVKDATMEPMPQFDPETNELQWTDALTGQVVPESERQLMLAQGRNPEEFQVIEEMVLAGDVGSEILSPLQVFIDSSVRSIDDLAPDQAVYIAKIRTLGWIEANYDVNKDTIQNIKDATDVRILSTDIKQFGDPTGSVHLQDLIPRIQGSRTQNDPDMAVVVERFQPISEKNPRGKYSCFIPGEQMLHDGDSPYESIPLVDFHWSPTTTSFWNNDYVSDLIAPQRFLNKRLSQLGEQANASIYADELLGPTLKRDDIPSDYPAPIEGGLTDGGVKMVQRRDPPQLPAWFMQSVELTLKLMREIAGGVDLFSESKFPGQMRGPMAVPMLQEIIDTQWGNLYQHLGQRLGKVKEMRINRVKQYYPPFRTLHYTDNSMKDEVFIFQTSDILRSGTDYSITVERGSLIPELRALREARIREHLQSPLSVLYIDERTGRIDKEKIAADLSMGDIGREDEESRYRKLAMHLVERLWQGEQLPEHIPMPFWNLKVIMDELESEMATTEWLSASPPIQQGFVQFWNKCRQFLVDSAKQRQEGMQDQQIQGAVAQAAQQAAAKAAAEAIDMAMDQIKASSEIAPQAPQALAQAMSQQNQQGPQ